MWPLVLYEVKQAHLTFVDDRGEVSENEISTNIFAIKQKKKIVYFRMLSYKDFRKLQGHFSLILV